MPFAYPALTDAREAIPTVTAILRREEVTKEEAVKSTWVLLGYGASLYPGEPGVFASAPSAYDNERAAADLETLTNFSGPEEKAGIALPWNLILPLLMQALMEWLKKR